jgi:hypothetical protein
MEAAAWQMPTTVPCQRSGSGLLIGADLAEHDRLVFANQILRRPLIAGPNASHEFAEDIRF